MKEVTKDEFYRLIYDGKLNVHPRIDGPPPYTSVFMYSDQRREFGRIVEEAFDGTCYPPKEHYLITD